MSRLAAGLLGVVPGCAFIAAFIWSYADAAGFQRFVKWQLGYNLFNEDEEESTQRLRLTFGLIGIFASVAGVLVIFFGEPVN